MQIKVLVIDDDRSLLELVKFQLESRGCEVFTVENGISAIELVKVNLYDVILTDLNLPDMSGIEIVRECKELAPKTEIIMITGVGSVEKAVEATKAGAFYYLEKPFEADELHTLVIKAVERKTNKAEIKSLRGKLKDATTGSGIIGSSPQMKQIFDIINNVADSDANILILGESGTGKELIANEIHRCSDRSDCEYVQLNCSALPSELIESQLFGHTAGAFTGAKKTKEGFIGRAKGGSLLLDEIGEMPLELQPKLLRVLQEQTYYPVGSEKPKKADFRLISATNRDPLEAIRDGSLREDLYYRINTIEIKLPPLRERPDDLPLLSDHFLKKYAAKYNRNIETFSDDAFKQIMSCEWRGNVRELEHTIERAVLMTKTGVITSLDISAQSLSAQTSEIAKAKSVGSAGSIEPVTRAEHDAVETKAPAQDFFEHIGNRIINEIVSNMNENETEEDVFNKLEYGIVRAAMEETKGNKSGAAKLLGLHRPRLYGMIKRHKISDS